MQAPYGIHKEGQLKGVLLGKIVAAVFWDEGALLNLGQQ
jgi:hypothetical protein